MEVAEAPTVDLYHEEEGEGEPLLMIHGFCTHIYTWRHIRKPLAERFKLYMLDLKGFGRSAKIPDSHYTVYDQAHAVLHFIRKHDLSDLTIVGHSFGGGVSLITALYLLEKMPGRLKRLVLIDSVGYPQPLPPFLNLIQLPLLGGMGVNLVPSRLIVKGMFMRAYYDMSVVTDADIDAYARPFDEPDSRKALLAASRHMIPEDLDELSGRYNSIDCPTLIIWGERDRVVPIDIGRELNRNIPGSRMEVIEKCGHVPQEEQPEKTLNIIDDFLKSAL